MIRKRDKYEEILANPILRVFELRNDYKKMKGEGSNIFVHNLYLILLLK